MPKKKPAPKKPTPVKKSSSQAKLVIWIAVAALAVVLAFIVLRPAPASVESIDAAKLEELATGGVRVLDVRSAGEYAQGHVPGAVNVPYTEVGVAAADWDREQPIAVYCLTGSRSDAAVTTLTSMGFSKIFHFDVGFQAWRGPVEAGTGSAVAAVETPEVSGPVMYEFYSDG